MSRIVTTLLAVLLASPCAARPVVVASIPPLHSLASMVAGPEADVRLLLRGATSAHSHQLKPSEARMLAAADLVLWIGPELEGYLVRPLATLAPGRSFAMLDADGVVRLPARAAGVHEHPAEPAAPAPGGQRGIEHRAPLDPHLWLDPRNAIAIVAHVAALLEQADPRNRERYRSNAAAATDRLASLDAGIDRELAAVRDRPFVSIHDALAYFVRRYRLRSIGAMVAAPERRPGAQTITRLRAAVRAAGVRCVLVEPGMRAALEQALGLPEVRRGVFDPLGVELAPGPGLYPELMRTNASALVGCLAG